MDRETTKRRSRAHATSSVSISRGRRITWGLAGRTGRPGVGVNYAAAKAGIVGLTQTLAHEAGPAGVYVNAIAPGPILTKLTQQVGPKVFAQWNVGRAVSKDGLPEDVAEAVLFLASAKSDWITGVTLDINGGIFIT